ncbi:SDR family NAD(P)-dependent oxidoreductase [Pseudomonas putida]|uniref:SDR family NAD(P)-dependent oxidoreductase n=1 Tax=Pseudomonas TaxID=286 RepID=UPI0006D46D36|nr:MULTISPECIES: SDR family NAD(P)-dependent oxidoreductase [Pseudomonas]MBI6941566.1 SDR family NAD(P)-dependent oxidoreductase [Pseudomonas putida]MBI6957825.1 SDR family NAD(P)-dependent oxidoreductase [Pseudomonas putida]PZQ38720.1 MAG: KR domain-containing protein [Pseudomonas putida]
MSSLHKKWFITGASGGLGLELTKAALAAGHTVVAAVRRPQALSQLRDQYGQHLILEQLDLTDVPAIQVVAARHTDVDFVVNNAGGAVIGAMEEFSDAEIQQQLNLNLVAPIYVTRAFLPALRARKSGRILYVTSVGGRVGFASGSMYHAAKFGLEGFAEAVAQEVEGFGIKTLIIEPGSIKTNFQANIQWTQESEVYRDSAVGAVRRYIEEMGAENTAGDPVKMAAAIFALAQQAEPPLRTALGVDVFATLQKSYAESLRALEAQKELALSVAIEGKSGFVPS